MPSSFSSKPTQKEKISFIKVNQSVIYRTKLVKKVCSRKVSNVMLKLKKVNSKQNISTSSVFMYQPEKEQSNSVVRYRKYIMTWTSYAKKIQKKKKDKMSTSSTTIAGDFNVKISIKNGSENCIGQCSRGRRNDSGFKLVEFYEMNNKAIVNSCFHHPAKLITTLSKKIINPTAKIVTNI